MLRNSFGGHHPSHFHMNSMVKAVVVGETFLWSARNFITPLFAVFAADTVEGGSLQLAATAFSALLVTRVIFELITGKILTGKNEMTLLKTTIAGIILLSFTYFGLGFSYTILPVFILFAAQGIGLGIASPAKNTLFSVHLDRNKESMEWGIHDSMVFGTMAASSALGGFIASDYGFQVLFVSAGIVNTLSILPYIIYMKHVRKSQKQVKKQTKPV